MSFELKVSKLGNTKLGQGDIGVVYPYGKHKLKVIKTMGFSNNEMLSKLLQPIVLGSNLDHPNIAKVLGYCLLQKELYQKMARYRESLADKIDRCIKMMKTPSKSLIVKWLHGSVSGLEYLQSKRICHQNIKPGNILLDNEKNVKISDIGMCRQEESKFYISPELAQKAQNGAEKQYCKYKSDAWSLGMVFLELCLLDTMVKEKCSEPSRIEENLRKNMEKLKKGVDGEEMSGILSRLLQMEPEKRTSFGDMRQYLEERYAQELGMKQEQQEDSEFSIKDFIANIPDIHKGREEANLKAVNEVLARDHKFEFNIENPHVIGPAKKPLE